MKVKVTDPCYVISNEAWDELCKKASDAYPADWVETFEKLVNEYLVEKTGVAWAEAGGTGFGDWGNEMAGPAVKSKGFYADAGMWCVVPEEFSENTTDTSNGGAAILEFDDGTDVSVSVLELNDGQWTEFAVSGYVDGVLTNNYSQPFNMEEEDDYDF